MKILIKVVIVSRNGVSNINLGFHIDILTSLSILIKLQSIIFI
jgi:hypothetical protein